MIEVLFTQSAEQDYTDSLTWYGERSRAAAKGFEDELMLAIEKISSSPRQYPKCDDLHRYYRLRRYPFQVIYREVAENRCIVVAVAHTSRAPRYWENK